MNIAETIVDETVDRTKGIKLLDEMDEHKEAAKHDFLDINDKKTEKKRETRLQNRLIVDESRDDINEKADAFIKNFRDQLKIQREDSLKRTLPLDDLLGV
ncbi:hypothetical protein OIU85_028812 [Salix viminalis]|uniref:Uncharacterized protein n=1 Tax=Salix viminalis TaxID=40686 RepID=A0A9Q0T6G3_SALVM|nr:hypothetical protein OIU85_028812 [Salix viminalis]